MLNRGFVVIGPAGSGTRIVTKVFIDSGCWGSAEHVQPFDDILYGRRAYVEVVPPDIKHIVLRRSFPHGPSWPHLPWIEDVFRTYGFDPFFIVTIRDWWANMQSWKRGLAEMMAWYNQLMGGLLQIKNYCFFLTSFMFLRPREALKGLSSCIKFDLNLDAAAQIVQADDKYYA